MQELKINVENSKISEAFKSFVVNYKANIADYMNQLIANDGSPCDAEIRMENGEITVFHISPDKGFVLGEVEAQDGQLPFQVVGYKNLETDKRYLLLEQGRLSLILKQEDGVADIRLGSFKSIGDAAEAWNSEAVLGKLQEAEQWKKARQKDLKRLQKLGKIEDAQVVTENE